MIILPTAFALLMDPSLLVSLFSFQRQIPERGDCPKEKLIMDCNTGLGKLALLPSFLVWDFVGRVGSNGVEDGPR